MSNRRAVPALVETGERLAPASTVGQTPEAPSPSDDASASGPTSRCAGKDWGGGGDSGGLGTERAPPKSCSVKSSRASTEWSRTARSATSALMASMSRESASRKRPCEGGEILPTTHWQRRIPAAPIAPPLTKMASAPMMISGSMQTLPGGMEPATEMAGVISAERGVTSSSPFKTKIPHFGFRGPANMYGASEMFRARDLPHSMAVTVRSRFRPHPPTSL